MSDETFSFGDEDEEGERLHVEDSADCWCEPLLIADCPACQTTGSLHDTVCPWCKGAGYLSATDHGEGVHIVHIEGVIEGEDE